MSIENTSSNVLYEMLVYKKWLFLPQPLVNPSLDGIYIPFWIKTSDIKAYSVSYGSGYCLITSSGRLKSSASTLYLPARRRYLAYSFDHHLAAWKLDSGKQDRGIKIVCAVSNSCSTKIHSVISLIMKHPPIFTFDYNEFDIQHLSLFDHFDW